MLLINGRLSAINTFVTFEFQAKGFLMGEALIGRWMLMEHSGFQRS